MFYTQVIDNVLEEGVGKHGLPRAVLERELAKILKEQYKMEVPQACLSKRSIVDTGDGTMYASHNCERTPTLCE